MYTKTVLGEETHRLSNKEKFPVATVCKEGHDDHFWDMKEPITLDFLEKGATVNSVSNCQLLYFIYWMTLVYIYIYIYIVIHRQTVSLYHNSSVWLDTLAAEIETWLTQMPIQDSTTQPRGNQHKWRKFKRLCITFVLFTYICLTATESSIHLKSLACGNHYFLR